MIDVNQLRKGTTFVSDGELYKVLSYSHNKPGRGTATIRVQVRNLRSGSTQEITFGSGQRVEDVRVESRQVEYLYDDGDFLVFMDTETYEQPQLRREIFGDDSGWLKENMRLSLLSFDSEVIDYDLPINEDYKVIEAEPAVAGDTVNNPTKRVTIETGREVRAPMFVNVGDTIRIKLEEAAYVTRV